MLLILTMISGIRERKVSKKKYKEACEKDASLPSYDNEPAVQSWETKMKRLLSRKLKASRPPNEEIPQPIPLEFLNDPTKEEARAWLNRADKKIRTLGEIPSLEESLALVEEAYAERVEARIKKWCLFFTRLKGIAR